MVEPYNVDFCALKRFDTVARIRLFLGCKCKLNDVKTTYCFLFQMQVGSMAVIPALHNNGGEESDESYLDLISQPSGVMASKEGTGRVINHNSSVLPVSARECGVCGSVYVLRSITVPSSTWMLVVEFPEGLRKTHFSALNSVKETRISGIVFGLAFLLLQEGDRLISLHLHDKDWYYYEDQGEARKVLVRPDRFVMKTRHCLRAIYFRRAEKNPHRCMRRLDQLYPSS